MRARSFLRLSVVFTVLSVIAAAGPPASRGASPVASATPLDTAAIERVLGLHGTMVEGVFKVTKPRGDLNVRLDGFDLTPRMGLTGWFAFLPHGGAAMLMGDLPLAEDEIQPVLSALEEGGVEVSGLHNHFLGEEPRIMFLHVGGMGDPTALSRGLRGALDAIDRVRASRRGAASAPPAPSRTWRMEFPYARPGRRA